jgi:hypothetical protein
MNVKEKSYASCFVNNIEEYKENKITLNNYWTTINKKTKEIVISESTKLLKEKYEKENYYRKLEKMINRWNNYRDEMNDLLGDRSPFLNYKKEIDNMVKEDIKINKMIEKRENEKYDSDSDEENNKNLLY